MGESALDDFELRFVEEYCVDLNHKQAAIRAGERSERAGARGRNLLRKQEIQQAIDVRLAELSKQSVVNAEYVRSRLKEVVERCMQQVPVMEKIRGEGGKTELAPTGEYKFDAGGANKALELLGKHLGMFSEHTTITIEHELKALTQDQLNARIIAMQAEHQLLTLEPGADGVYTASEPQIQDKLEQPVEQQQEQPQEQ